MTRNSEDSTIFSTLVAISSIVSAFVGYALYRGKKKELLVSTAILVGVWFFEHLLFSPAPKIWYLYPLIGYAIYWVFVFWILPEGQVSFSSEKHWGDLEWWWSLDGWQFEEEVAKVFRKRGYKATVTKKTGDDGVDIIMYKDKRKYIVQCKHYTSEVGPEVARALWGVREDFKADEVILVASSGVTRAVSKFVDNKPNFIIYDLKGIIGLIP